MVGQEGSGGRDEKWAGLHRLPCPLPSPPPLSSGRGAAARSGPAAWSGPHPVLSPSRSPSIATSAWGSLRAAPFSPSAYAFPPPSAATNLTRLISYTNELRTRETTVPSIADAAVRNGWAGLSRGWEEAALCSFSLPLFFPRFSSISIIFPNVTFVLPCSPSASIIFSSLLFSFPLCRPSCSHIHLQSPLFP